MTTLFIVTGLLTLLLCGIPVAFALLGFGLILLVVGDFSITLAPLGLFSSMDSFVLLAVPLFLLMSNILLEGKVGQDLFAAVQAWVGHWPGGLAVATVISCAIFAAISGSSVATAATVGTVAIPEMIERGYPRRFVLGLLAAGGTLGILIPPSIVLIIYGVITESSVLKLFTAGIGPGLLIVGLFILYSVVYALRSQEYEPSEPAGWAIRKSATLRAGPTAALALFVLAGIYRGWFTPTEAAAIGFAGAIFVTTVVLRSITWPGFKAAIYRAMVTSVSILLIVAGAKVFGKAIALWRVPQNISELISTNVHEPLAFIFVIALVLLVVGLFLEALSMMLIMVPVLAGSLAVLGIDVIWFGIFFVIMIECALITPPVGLNLFVIQSVGGASMRDVAMGVLPFLILMLFAVLLITISDAIVLFPVSLL
ncbi:C4-dicarboxylate ABC transporter permease [Notoacmeibacter marinus]|uniref:TRAP transporter large permease protein n=1 Tax=Notoacmeibacter marinus TaxID=1876515 RepID=A0A231V1Y9_9HYPH|nr:TRAP transporter large permease [Notoacmeibacter marinus]OXT02160.1 C4-dicarboxylate ABC transporter permease [Notoacmeibacter marinus]